MKLKASFNIAIGIATETLYTLLIILAGFIICLIISKI